MKISLSWLKDYIDIDLSPERVSEILTAIGLEVEGMEEVESVKGGLRNFVIGHVLECRKHSNADKLSVTRVDTGQGEPSQIVCGAPNVAAGQKVVVALPGAKIYSADGEFFEIKKAKIRGEESKGMICAADEIGLGTDHSGIMVLDDDPQIGTAASSYFGVETDIVYDIGLTPNRSDATSHLGVARDLLAYLQVNENSNSSLRLPEADLSSADKTHQIEVQLDDKEACPRFSGICISDIRVKESPDWLKRRLNSIGVRPISNIVDITNFVLHEMGQPLHAYDKDQIAQDKVIVKFLPEGTTFNSLDGKERKLKASDLMICDGDSNGMCMAGVFGGEKSGVTDKTNTIFLESAHFHAKTIRRTSMSHVLRTDAAMVFEKGSDPAITVDALKRAASLMVELADGKITSDLIDIYPSKIEKIEISLRMSQVNKVIGNDIPEETVEKILRALDFEIIQHTKGVFDLKVPTCRADVLREIDVIEEILRIYGFDQVKLPSSTEYTLIPAKYPDPYVVQNQIADLLIGRGFSEMMGLSLTRSSELEAVGADSSSFVRINNTSNVDLNIMRPNMILSGMETLSHNLNRRQDYLRLFEFGKEYKTTDEGFEEQKALCIHMTGKEQSHWMSAGRNTDFYALKTAVHVVLERMGIHKYQKEELEDEFFQFGLRYYRGKNEIARFGQLHPQKIGKLGISAPVFTARINWDELLRSAGKEQIKVQAPSKFPTTSRDLALTLQEQVSFEEIEKIARKIGKTLLKEISLFDVYKSKEMEKASKKSYAVSFVFGSHEKTLQDKEIDKLMQQLMQKLESELGAEIRK